MPPVLQPFRYFPFMTRGFFIGPWANLCEAGRHKSHTICHGETARFVPCLMLFVSLFRGAASHTHVVTVFARLVIGVVIPEFTVRQYRQIQLDDVNHEALRVVGSHAVLNIQIKIRLSSDFWLCFWSRGVELAQEKVDSRSDDVETRSLRFGNVSKIAYDRDKIAINQGGTDGQSAVNETTSPTKRIRIPLVATWIRTRTAFVKSTASDVHQG